MPVKHTSLSLLFPAMTLLCYDFDFAITVTMTYYDFNEMERNGEFPFQTYHMT